MGFQSWKIWNIFYCLYEGVPLFNNYKKNHAWQHFIAWLTLFPFANIASPFTNNKDTTQKTTGSTIQPVSSLILNQGRTRKIFILSCFWNILQYEPMKIKEEVVGGLIITKKITHDNILLHDWHYPHLQILLLLSLIIKTPHRKQQDPQYNLSPLWY